jgi:hypothetical protein
MGWFKDRYSSACELERRIDHLSLRTKVNGLKEHGYTLLQDPEALAMADDVRDAIGRLARDTVGPLRGRTAALLLGRDPVFSKTLMLPSLLTLVEFILGRGAILSQLVGSVRQRGSPPLEMHVDNSWFPEPFPEWEMTCTACWVTDVFTREAGCTFAVPGSHLQRRHPPMDVRRTLDGAIPLEAPKGSIWLWTGSLWHGNYPRLLEGERIVLHMTFNRIGIHPIEDYGHLDSAWIREQPEEIAGLLGRRILFGTTTCTSGGVDPLRAVETFRCVHGRNGY